MPKTLARLGAAALLIATLPARAVVFLADENLPFNYVDGGKLAGIVTDAAAEIAKRAGVEAQFEAVDWETGYARAQRDRDTCLYSTVRAENREKLFHWIGPVAVNRWGVYAKKSFAATIGRVEDMRTFRVGGVTNDAKLDYLAMYAVTGIRSVERDVLNPPRLALPKDDPNRIDLWITSTYTARRTAREAGVTDIKPVFIAREVPLYIACNPATPRPLVKAMSDALAAMKKDGTLKKITADYERRFDR
jgi:polar amino acid transport system substrate-binding protein